MSNVSSTNAVLCHKEKTHFVLKFVRPNQTCHLLQRYPFGRCAVLCKKKHYLLSRFLWMNGSGSSIIFVCLCHCTQLLPDFAAAAAVASCMMQSWLQLPFKLLCFVTKLHITRSDHQTPLKVTTEKAEAVAAGLVLTKKREMVAANYKLLHGRAKGR